MTFKLKMKIASCLILGCAASNSVAQTTTLSLDDFRIAVFSTATLIDTANRLPNSNPNSCPGGGRFLHLEVDLPNGEYMQALLLEARATNTPIRIGINGCVGDRFPRVISVNR